MGNLKSSQGFENGRIVETELHPSYSYDEATPTTKAGEGLRLILAGLHEAGEALGSGAPIKILLALTDVFKTDHRALALMQELAGSGFTQWSEPLSQTGDRSGISKQAVSQRDSKISRRLTESHPILAQLIEHRGNPTEAPPYKKSPFSDAHRSDK